MKVLFVLPHIFAGGAEKAALHLAHRLEGMGHDVAICTLSLDLKDLPSHFSSLRFILNDELPIKEVNSTLSALRRYLKELRALSSLIVSCRDEYDIALPYNFPSYWAAALKLHDIPIVWMCSEVLGPYRETSSLYERSLVFRASMDVLTLLDAIIVRKRVGEIVTISELNRRAIKERYGREAKVVPTGVDFEFFGEKVVNPKDRLGLKGSFVLSHVGSLVGPKNPSVSLRALSLLRGRLRDVKLILVGDGPLLKELKAEARALGVERDVLFLGRVSEEQLRVVYQATDINLYPVTKQTWGLVPFEALASGTLSVVSRDAGAAEVIEREGIGLLADPEPEAFAKAVLYARDHKKECQDMIARGREYVRRNLSWQGYAMKMLSILEEVKQPRK